VVATTLVVSGWAITEDGGPEVTVTVTVDDGEPWPVNGRRWRRYMAGTDAEWSGWDVVLDVAGLSPGPHVLTVTARDDRGRLTSLQRFFRRDPDGLYGRWRGQRDPARWRALVAEAALSGEVPSLALLPVDEGEGAAWAQARSDAISAVERAAAEAGVTVETAPVGTVGEALERLLERDTDLGVILGDGAVPRPDAALAIAATAALTGGPDVIYADDDTIDVHGRRTRPRFKPQWSPELLLSTDYVGPFVAVGRRAARAVVQKGDPPPVSLYETLVRLVDTDVHVERVPDVLVSLAAPPPSDDAVGAEVVRAVARRRGSSAEVSSIGGGRRRVVWKPSARPKVSAVITTGLREDLLINLLESVAEHTSHEHLEIVVVNSGEGDLERAQRWLDGFEHRVVRAPGPFNYSAANNIGARAATGDYLLFLNDDVEVRTANWIERLVGQAEQPGVGIVGVLLVYPSGHVECAGVVLDPSRGMPKTQLHLHPQASGGSEHLLELTRNTVAVSTACALLPTALFREVGGFDEGLVMELGDIDLSLRIWHAGRRVVWTPEVVLTHHFRSSRGRAEWPADHERFSARWEDLLMRGDPFLNPSLSVTPEHEIRDGPPSLEGLRRSLGRSSGRPPWRPEMLTTPAAAIG